jgi:hypothetical protein
LQALVSRLRRHLPDGAVESHRAGYRLAVEPDAVDVRRFERLAGELARLAGELAAARGRFAIAADQAAALSVPPHVRALLASSVGLLEATEGDLDAARSGHREALRHALTSGDAPVIGRVLVGLADLAPATGDPRRAAALRGASVAIRGTEDRSLVDAGRVAAAARAALGEPEFAEAYADGRAIVPTAEAVTELAAPLTPSA